MEKGKLIPFVLACSLMLIILAPIALSRLMLTMPAAEAVQTKTRSLGLGWLLLARSGIHPAVLSSISSSELSAMVSELQSNSLPVSATASTPPNYIAIARYQEAHINADNKFSATKRTYNLPDYSSCSGTYVSDSDYGNFIIYAFSTDVGTSGPMTVTDSWLKGLTFNTGPSLLSPSGGPPPCDNTKSVFIIAVVANLPSGSSWGYDPSKGTFSLTVGGMSPSTLYYLLFYYFPKSTNTDTNFFGTKPSLLFTPTPLIVGQQYIVTSGVSPFTVKQPGSSWPDYVRVYTRIPPFVAQGGTGVWFVSADPYYWDGQTCSFPPNTCDGSGSTRWRYYPPWDVTSANPMVFSWNHIYYGQLVYSGATFGGCSYRNKAQVGVDFYNVGVDLVAQNPYPNNLPKVTPGTYPNNLRISLEGAIDMGTVTGSFGGSPYSFDIWNYAESWVDWIARYPVYTASC